MTHSSNRRSRRGFAIPTPLLWGLGAAGVALIGFMVYNAYKKKQQQAQPYAQNGYYQQRGGYAQQQQGFMPPAPPKGGHRYAYAPGNSVNEDARAGGEDPELTRLFAESQLAHSELAAAAASGSEGAASRARDRLDRAKSALAAKKASMY